MAAKDVRFGDGVRNKMMVGVNVLANALTHGAPGTPVRVDASTDATRLELSVANRGEPIPPATQQRLWGVLERYLLWLERLPETDRERVRGAPDKKHRLQIIKEIREREWVDRLPLRLRNELLTIEDTRKRAARVAEVRREEREIRKLVQNPPRPRGFTPRPARLEQFPPEVRHFVKEQLDPHLGPAEKQQLERAGRLECCWQRDQLTDAIRDLVLDDQRLRNDICWSVFDC